jgi:plastocyanin
MKSVPAIAAALLATLARAALAAPPVVEIEIRNHLFVPARVTVPAGTKVKLLIHNRDATPEEFESYVLNREKVIVGESTATLFIGPLKPGEYEFFGEFNRSTALGAVIAE